MSMRTNTFFKKKLLPSILAASLLTPSLNVMAANAGASINGLNKPTGLEMFTDMLIVRPAGIIATALGTATFVVALPFTLASGSVADAGETLVVNPAMYTFVRCLGCTKTGYAKDDAAESDEERAEEQAEEAAQ